MIYIFLADGFEEMEAIAPIDILRRGGVDIKTVSITENKKVVGAHGIEVTCDLSCGEINGENIEGIILPGGMPGTLNLEKSPLVQKYLDLADNRGLLIAAICAAPSVLGHKGILKGKKATCFKGFEKDLAGATVLTDKVVKDANIITSCGAGAAYDFGFMILDYVKGNSENSREISSSMRYSE